MLLPTDFIANLEYAQDQTVPPGSLTEKVVLLVAGALLGGVLGFLSNLLLDRIKAGREPTKRLSWNASVRRALIEVSDDIKSKVRFLYEGIPVTALTHVRCTVTNTGNQVVKEHVLRFPFPEEVTVLEHYLDPMPQPELEVTLIEDSPEGHYRYRVGHIEPNEQVVFNFVTAGGALNEWQPYSRNPEGGVEFQRRDVTGLKQDQDHLLPFFVNLLLLLTLPAAAKLSGFGYLGGFASAAVTVALLLLILPHVRPLVRIVELLVTRVKEPTVRGTHVIQGDVIARNVEVDIPLDPAQQRPDVSAMNGEAVGTAQTPGDR